MGNSEFPYLHGFSKKEQDRLRTQAEFAEFIVYQDVNFSGVKNLLELGCGVGAQTEILLRRFPKLNIVGIDLNDNQLNAANEHLANFSQYKNRYSIQKMNAEDIEFESHSFDAAFLCWILEHVPSPINVLAEVRRVLKPGAKIIITEVMNSSFFLDPYSPNVWKYWMAYNDFQYENAGDPFVGAKLGNLLASAGFSQIETKVKTWHLDNRYPSKRKETIDFWSDLLMSGAQSLIDQKVVNEELVKLAKEELKKVSRDPNAVFFYSFIQAHAKAV